MTGKVFDISRGCVDDGPGLRTVVFLKGCRLDCPWCHNPESKSSAPQIAFDQNLCIGCLRCVDVCPRTWAADWRDGCTACGLCAEACPSGARRLVGREMTVSDLVETVLEDRDFMEGTGGGVTFSGGEPLLQAGFVFDCSTRLRSEGIHVAVETSGLWPAKLAKESRDKIDLILFDLKHVDLEKLRRVMGVKCDRILGNLKALFDSGVPMELRLTLVPGFNDDEDDFVAITEWLRSVTDAPPPLWLLPFQRLAAAKETIYGTAYPFRDIQPMSDTAVAEAARNLTRLGVNAEYE